MLTITQDNKYFEIKYKESELRKIPYFAKDIDFSIKKTELTFTCKTKNERIVLIDIINSFLSNKKIMYNQELFIDYLKCYIYLGFYNVLQFFSWSFYEKLDWSKFREYFNILIDIYDKIFLCIQLNKFHDLSGEEYVEFTKEIPQPTNIEFDIKPIKLKLVEILLRTGIRTKNHYDLIDVLIDAGHGLLLWDTVDSDNFSKRTEYNKTITEISIKLLTLDRISDAEVLSILQINKYPNILSSYILMKRYLKSNNLDKAIEIFKETKTCQTDIFIELFCISNNEQQSVILSACREKNKFTTASSDKYYRYVSVHNMILDIDENDLNLNRIDIPLLKFKYGTLDQYNGKINGFSSSHGVELFDYSMIISYTYNQGKYIISKNNI